MSLRFSLHKNPFHGKLSTSLGQFHAKMMGDIMYLQQALNQLDAKQLVHAIVKEVNGHFENSHWALVTCDAVPDDAHIVPSVWSMQYKWDLTTSQVPQGPIETY
jgi:hypothetical protein